MRSQRGVGWAFPSSGGHVRIVSGFVAGGTAPAVGCPPKDCNLQLTASWMRQAAVQSCRPRECPVCKSRLHLCRLPVYGIHDGNAIVVCSPELAQFAGASSPDDVVGRDPLSFFSRDARDHVVSAITRCSPLTYRTTGTRLNGDKYPIEITAQEIRLHGARARMFTVRNVSPVAVVVDDEKAVAEVAGTLLRHAGYQTVVYQDPHEMLAEFEPRLISVLVTDVMMPNMNGVDLVRSIRVLDNTLPAIVITGFTDVATPEDAYTIRVNKPFGFRDLQAALDALPDRARSPIE
jgi:CheY-like chemotaxis protein